MVVEEELWPYLLESLQAVGMREADQLLSHIIPLVDSLEPQLARLALWSGLVCIALRRQHAAKVLPGKFIKFHFENH